MARTGSAEGGSAAELVEIAFDRDAVEAGMIHWFAARLSADFRSIALSLSFSLPMPGYPVGVYIPREERTPMKIHVKSILAVAALALGLVPAFAIADGPGYNPGHGGGPSYGTPGGPPHGNAYGFFCKAESKKHKKGEKGTAFSRCVKRMAKADKKSKMAPGQVCKGLSKKHKKGEKGTAFSRCVKAVAKMRAGTRYVSPPMVFGPTGWGGWSCPAGTTLIDGGYEPSTATVAFSAAAKPGEAMYPAYPHYVFGSGETGWVVQNDNDTETITVFVVCA